MHCTDTYAPKEHREKLDRKAILYNAKSFALPPIKKTYLAIPREIWRQCGLVINVGTLPPFEANRYV